MDTRHTITTEIHLYDPPHFAVVTHRHTEGAWVHAVDDEQQRTFWQLASDADMHGMPLEFEYTRYIDEPGDRRHYFGVTHLRVVRDQMVGWKLAAVDEGPSS